MTEKHIQVACPECGGDASETCSYGDTIHFGSMDMQPPETEALIITECECGYYNEYETFV